jgi:uncharacterized protein (DUF952 family)
LRSFSDSLLAKLLTFTESDFKILPQDGRYIPALFAQDGFIHCTVEPNTLLCVAGDYFWQVVEPVLVLAIDLPRVTATVKFEPPASIPNNNSSHNTRRTTVSPHPQPVESGCRDRGGSVAANQRPIRLAGYFCESGGVQILSELIIAVRLIGES